MLGTETKHEDLPTVVAEPTAEWTLPPESERVAPITNESVLQRLLAWLFLISGFGFFLVVRGTVVKEVTYVVSTGEAIVLIAISQGVLYYLYRRMANLIMIERGFARLKSKVPEGADLPVRVEIYREGSLTGMDQGYVWLTEGTWYFKGMQTAFRFNQQDVVPIEAWSRWITPDPGSDKPPTCIPMKSLSGRLEIRLHVIDRHEDYAKRKKANAFFREMYDWLKERPRGAIESVLPPLRIHPDLERSGLTKYEGLCAAMAMLIVDTAVMAGLPKGEVDAGLGSYGATMAVLVGGLMMGAVWLAWLETRDIMVRSRLKAVENERAD